MTFSTNDVLTIVGLTVGMASVLATVMLVYFQFRKTKYDFDKQRVELESLRRSIESQLHQLNEKLVGTEARWRDVNHLLISSQNRQPDDPRQIQRVSLTPFLQVAGVNEADLAADPALVFVLTPLHPDYQKEFEIIALVCRELGLKVLRGDEEYVSGELFPHILKLIVRARVVIANIEGRNPNVFYELGLAHGLGKPTILVARLPDDVPFDFRTKKLVLYKTDRDLQEKLRVELARIFVEPRST